MDIMRKRLDPENLGIILLNAFMDEFFPEEKRSVPDTFDLLHYNGIPGSNYGNQVSDILCRVYTESESILNSYIVREAANN